ncbi:mitochondrial inner membrane protease subunit 2 [Diplodia corticola]|uniref:Mitochondrial inner membrane protease subunit 2 n=1 Tax=Diplodia corticola TaxID=236234 RepID=A0A1J9RPI4_9PEZI|nr:mitochondrial inner membrane protease subunit 2 [Diplodia corticola]OJD34467.1 mitochondrial inner membrane protease subunit 2 [Diplodia corticola]
MAARIFSRLPTARSTARFAYYAAFGMSVLVFARSNVLEVTGVQGQSMAPTLSPRYNETGEMDEVFFNRMVAPQLLRRGDIVSFWAPHKPEQLSVKRIVALPGDTVITRGRYPFKKVVVPYNHVWVEGDNWRKTVDSNDFGPIPMGLINGRAEYIVLPWSRIRKVSDPNVEFKTFSKVIPAKVPATLPPELAD